MISTESTTKQPTTKSNRDTMLTTCECVCRSTGKICHRTARKVHALDKARRVCGLHVKAPLPPPTIITHSGKNKTALIDHYFKKQIDETKRETVHIHIVLLWVMHVLTWIVMGVYYYSSLSQAALPPPLPPPPVAGRLPPWLRLC